MNELISEARAAMAAFETARQASDAADIVAFDASRAAKEAYSRQVAALEALHEGLRISARE